MAPTVFKRLNPERFIAERTALKLDDSLELWGRLRKCYGGQGHWYYLPRANRKWSTDYEYLVLQPGVDPNELPAVPTDDIGQSVLPTGSAP